MATKYKKPFPEKWIILRGLVRGKYHWKGFDEKMKEQLNLKEVHTPELLGNGYLAGEETPKQIDTAIANLQSQVQFSYDGPVGIIGISLGGMLATRWAQLKPDYFTHLVLVNSSSTISPFYKRLKPQNYFNILKLILSPSPEATEKFIFEATSNDREKWKKYLAENIEFHRKHPLQFKNFKTQLELASQVNFRYVPQTENLVLTSNSDRLVDYRCSESISRGWRCPIRYNTRGAGHDMSFDDGQWILKMIQEEFS